MGIEFEIIKVILAEFYVLPYLTAFLILGIFFGAKKTDWKELWINLYYWPFWVIGNMLGAAIIYYLYIGNLKDWASHHSWVIHVSSLNPAILALLNLFLFDIFYYWYHRTEHKTTLWNYHVVHHADCAINATTAFRHHILENIIRVIFVDFPLMFILIDAASRKDVSWTTLILTTFISYLGVFAHSNIKIGFGPLSWLIICPQTHRIHHSIEKRHFDKNFAAYFPFIDVIFGTYYHPSKLEWPDTGVSYIGRELTSPWKMFSHPFKVWFRKSKKPLSTNELHS